MCASALFELLLRNSHKSNSSVLKIFNKTDFHLKFDTEFEKILQVIADLWSKEVKIVGFFKTRGLIILVKLKESKKTYLALFSDAHKLNRSSLIGFCDNQEY